MTRFVGRRHPFPAEQLEVPEVRRQAEVRGGRRGDAPSLNSFLGRIRFTSQSGEEPEPNQVVPLGGASGCPTFDPLGRMLPSTASVLKP